MSVERDVSQALGDADAGPMPDAIRQAVAGRRRTVRARRAVAGVCVLSMVAVLGWLVLPAGAPVLPTSPTPGGDSRVAGSIQIFEHSVLGLRMVDPDRAIIRRGAAAESIQRRPTVLGLRLSELGAYPGPAS